MPEMGSLLPLTIAVVERHHILQDRRRKRCYANASGAWQRCADGTPHGRPTMSFGLYPKRSQKIPALASVTTVVVPRLGLTQDFFNRRRGVEHRRLCSKTNMSCSKRNGRGIHLDVQAKKEDASNVTTDH